MKHQTISFIKSGLRLVGCGPLMLARDFNTIYYALGAAGALFFLAELVGIIEEIGHE